MPSSLSSSGGRRGGALRGRARGASLAGAVGMRIGARIAGFWRVRLAVPGLRRRWGSPAERLSARKRLLSVALCEALCGPLPVKASRDACEASTPRTPRVGEASVEPPGGKTRFFTANKLELRGQPPEELRRLSAE